MLDTTEWIKVHFHEMGKICGGEQIWGCVSYKFAFVKFEKNA